MKESPNEPSEDVGSHVQTELARPRSRRSVLVALTAGGLAVGAGLAGAAWWLTHHPEGGAAGLSVNTGGASATPAGTATPTGTATGVAPEDLLFEQGFLTNDPSVRKQLLQTVFRYDLTEGTEPQNRYPHLPYGVVRGEVFDAAHPNGKPVELSINDPNALQKADLLTCQYAFLYTKRVLLTVADKEAPPATRHLMLVGRFGGYTNPGQQFEEGQEPFTFDMPIGWFDPSPATEPNLNLTGLAYSATGAVTVDNADSTGGGYKTEELEQRLAKLKRQSMLVGIYTNFAASIAYLSSSLVSKYSDVVEVFEAQQPAAIELISQRGNASFANNGKVPGTKSLNTGDKPTSRPFVNGLKANASHT